MNTYAANTIEKIDHGFIFIHAISLVLTIVITVVMIYFVWRYNYKRNPVATDIHGNFWLEFAWSIIPVFIVMGMFFVGWDGYINTRSYPKGVFEVDVKGIQYAWEYNYPNGKILNKELVLPVNTPVKLNLLSDNVQHSFYIPAFRIKEDLVPYNPGYLTFTPLKEGEYLVFCAEFCGSGHSDMISKLRVVSRRDFDDWYNGKVDQQPIKMEVAMAASADQMAHGEEIYKQYCNTCHGPTGAGGGSANARNFAALGEYVNGHKVSQMFRSLQNGVNQNMPSFAHLLNEDKFAVIHYVRATFAPGHDKDTPEDVAALNTEYEIEKGKPKPPEIDIAMAMAKLAVDSVETTEVDQNIIEDLKKAHPVGSLIYDQNCASCHGTSGEGGIVASTLNPRAESRFINPPLNLANRAWQSGNIDQFRDMLRNSSLSSGGMKPTYSSLSKEDWSALFEYTKSLQKARKASSKDLAQAQ